MSNGTGWQVVASVSALGFHAFLAVLAIAIVRARTKEKLAIQETLRALVQSGAQVSPEVIDSLRRSRPKRTPAEILSRAKAFQYWGCFLIALGTLIALSGLLSSETSTSDLLDDLRTSGFVLFVLPGLFCLAHSAITIVTNRDIDRLR